MPIRINPAQVKRQKEATRMKRREEKEQLKAARKQEKDQKPADGAAEEDPDLAGIVLGPQPPKM